MVAKAPHRQPRRRARGGGADSSQHCPPPRRPSQIAHLPRAGVFIQCRPECGTLLSGGRRQGGAHPRPPLQCHLHHIQDGLLGDSSPEKRSNPGKKPPSRAGVLTSDVIDVAQDLTKIEASNPKCGNAVSLQRSHFDGSYNQGGEVCLMMATAADPGYDKKWQEY